MLSAISGNDLLVLIEDLHPNECVEHNCLQLVFLARCLVGQNGLPCEVEDEGNHELVNRLSNYHLPHRYSDERC